jgi:hypothetical protein
MAKVYSKEYRVLVGKNSRLRCTYGISPEELVKLIEKQGNKCAICRVVFGTEKKNSPHVDHDHSSGWVRGVLCTGCNTGLGNFGDDPNHLTNAADYLISNAPPTEFNIHAARQSVMIHPSDPRKYTPEERERRRQLMLGNKWRQGVPAWNRGKEWDADTRQKMSESAIRRWSVGEKANVE